MTGEFWTARRNGLKDYYFELAQDAQRASAEIRRAAVLLVGVLVLLPLAVCLMQLAALSSASSDAMRTEGMYWAGLSSFEMRDEAALKVARLRGSASAWTMALAFGLITFGVAVPLVLASLPDARLRRRIRAGQITVPTRSQGEVISSLLAEIGFACGEQIRITIWRDKNPFSVSPSIIARADDSHLVVPAQLFVLADPRNPRGDPEAVKAILTHEVGHLLQRDADLWSLAIAFSGGAFTGMLAALALVTFAVFAAGLSPPYLGVPALALQRVLSLRGKVLKARRNSEELADLFGVIFTEGNDYASALKRLVKDSSSSQVHPPLDERLSQAQGYATLACKDEQPPP